MEVGFVYGCCRPFSTSIAFVSIVKAEEGSKIRDGGDRVGWTRSCLDKLKFKNGDRAPLRTSDCFQ